MSGVEFVGIALEISKIAFRLGECADTIRKAPKEVEELVDEASIYCEFIGIFEERLDKRADRSNNEMIQLGENIRQQARRILRDLKKIYKLLRPLKHVQNIWSLQSITARLKWLYEKPYTEVLWRRIQASKLSLSLYVSTFDLEAFLRGPQASTPEEFKKLKNLQIQCKALLRSWKRQETAYLNLQTKMFAGSDDSIASSRVQELVINRAQEVIEEATIEIKQLSRSLDPDLRRRPSNHGKKRRQRRRQNSDPSPLPTAPSTTSQPSSRDNSSTQPRRPIVLEPSPSRRQFQRPQGSVPIPPFTRDPSRAPTPSVSSERPSTNSSFRNVTPSIIVSELVDLLGLSPAAARAASIADLDPYDDEAEETPTIQENDLVTQVGSRIIMGPDEDVPREDFGPWRSRTPPPPPSSSSSQDSGTRVQRQQQQEEEEDVDDDDDDDEEEY